ncbi:uncharacterized protein MONBRDRAFT_10719 [Monosiga brevicollis MX1]|uniref:Serine/threonine-protein kinase 11-interacting protein n=1 Tax=Monosiga brevicollis TaxID=81824 RepID=A9V713_MONBE|nr:uncharacterized protein MONBRDRAFT_10719 [Monosiga brevicollis MX1]EDQ86640.1 predicted protein [Monosiga brevicollis MX1]|eukprot:XP_001748476.1 hypothetical protein [Monosiga brevicollis MX1]
MPLQVRPTLALAGDPSPDAIYAVTLQDGTQVAQQVAPIVQRILAGSEAVRTHIRQLWTHLSAVTSLKFIGSYLERLPPSATFDLSVFADLRSLHSDARHDVVTWDELRELDVYANGIDSLDGRLALCPKLMMLNLGANDLEELTPHLKYLGNLHTLGLAFNRISSLRILERVEISEALQRLTSLSVAGNRLTSLNGIEHLMFLTLLDASSNPLNSIASVRVLRQLAPALRDVNLENCPVMQTTDARERILALFGSNWSRVMLNGRPAGEDREVAQKIAYYDQQHESMMQEEARITAQGPEIVTVKLKTKKKKGSKTGSPRSTRKAVLRSNPLAETGASLSSVEREDVFQSSRDLQADSASARSASAFSGNSDEESEGSDSQDSDDEAEKGEATAPRDQDHSNRSIKEGVKSPPSRTSPRQMPTVQPSWTDEISFAEQDVLADAGTSDTASLASSTLDPAATMTNMAEGLSSTPRRVGPRVRRTSNDPHPSYDQVDDPDVEHTLLVGNSAEKADRRASQISEQGYNPHDLDATAIPRPNNEQPWPHADHSQEPLEANMTHVQPANAESTPQTAFAPNTLHHQDSHDSAGSRGADIEGVVNAPMEAPRVLKVKKSRDANRRRKKGNRSRRPSSKVSISADVVSDDETNSASRDSLLAGTHVEDEDEPRTPRAEENTPVRPVDDLIQNYLKSESSAPTDPATTPVQASPASMYPDHSADEAAVLPAVATDTQVPPPRAVVRDYAASYDFEVVQVTKLADYLPRMVEVLGQEVMVTWDDSGTELERFDLTLLASCECDQRQILTLQFVDPIGKQTFIKFCANQAEDDGVAQFERFQTVLQRVIAANEVNGFHSGAIVRIKCMACGHVLEAAEVQTMSSDTRFCPSCRSTDLYDLNVSVAADDTDGHEESLRDEEDVGPSSGATTDDERNRRVDSSVSAKSGASLASAAEPGSAVPALLSSRASPNVERKQHLDTSGGQLDASIMSGSISIASAALSLETGLQRIREHGTFEAEHTPTKLDQGLEVMLPLEHFTTTEETTMAWLYGRLAVGHGQPLLERAILVASNLHLYVFAQATDDAPVRDLIDVVAATHDRALSSNSSHCVCIVRWQLRDVAGVSNKRLLPHDEDEWSAYATVVGSDDEEQSTFRPRRIGELAVEDIPQLVAEVQASQVFVTSRLDAAPVGAFRGGAVDAAQRAAFGLVLFEGQPRVQELWTMPVECLAGLLWSPASPRFFGLEWDPDELEELDQQPELPSKDEDGLMATWCSFVSMHAATEMMLAINRAYMDEFDIELTWKIVN